jgi:hypothetical protein
MKNSEHVCCFCRQEIHADFTDPCFLNLSTNRDREEVQEFTCHAECLNRVLHPDFSLLTQN